MEIIVKKSFIKTLKSSPKNVQESVKIIVEKIESAKSFSDIDIDLKKIEGQKKNENYYRIRSGDWRIGIEYREPNIILIIVLHRGTIYKRFPPK